MDEKLSQALERSNFMTTFSNQKRLLWEKFQDDLVYYKDGHEIKVSETLISLCKIYAEKQRSLIITDANNLPFEIEDSAVFLDELLDVYATASNAYFTDYNSLRKNRSVEGLVNL